MNTRVTWSIVKYSNCKDFISACMDNSRSAKKSEKNKQNNYGKTCDKGNVFNLYVYVTKWNTLISMNTKYILAFVD